MTPEAVKAAEQVWAALNDIKTHLLPSSDGHQTQNVQIACDRCLDARASMRVLMKELNGTKADDQPNSTNT